MLSEMEDIQIKSLIPDGFSQTQACNATVSPATRLPPELVAEILFQSQSSSEYINMHSNSTLCSICSTWRAVAMSTPRLWTTIRMAVSNRDYSKRMALLRLWCKRAGNLPLQIYLSSPSMSGNPISTLTPYVANVQTMNLCIPRSYIKSLQTLSKGTFCLLEFLSIEAFCVMSKLERDVGDTGDIDVFESAQRLTNVSLLGWTSGRKFLLPPQISHLIDHTPRSASSFFYVLRQCPNVVDLKLRLNFSDDSGSNVVHHQTFLLPHLDTLDLDLFGGSGEVALRSLIVPALRSFSVKSNEGWPHSSFMSLVSRSSCTLVRLGIFDADLDTQLFLECLRGLGSIVELQLDEPDAGRWLADALVYDAGDNEPLVPQLEMLTLGDWELTCAESFMRMVESRWWPDDQFSDPRRIARLETICLDTNINWRNVDEHVLQRLHRCQDEGLNIIYHGMS